MKKNNILITCAGGFFIYDFVECLKVQKNIKIIGIDQDSKAYSKTIFDKFYKSPQVNHKKKFLNFIFKIIKKEKINLIYALSENENNFFYKNYFIIKKKFKNIKFNFFYNKKLDIFLNKDLFYKYCKKNNIAVPNSIIIENLNEIENYVKINKKYILKSVNDSGSKNIFLINQKLKHKRQILLNRNCFETNTKDLRKIIDNTKKYLLCDYFNGEFFDADCISKNGKIVSHFIRKRQMYNKFLNYSSGHKIIKNNEITNLIKKFLIKLKYTGVCDFDIIKYHNKYYLMETSPRFSGSVGMGRLANINMPLNYLKFVNGAKIPKAKIKYNTIIRPFFTFKNVNNENLIEKYIPKFENLKFI